MPTKKKASVKKQLEAAVRLVKALKNPDASALTAKTDVGMYKAMKELNDAEAYAKEIGLEL